MRMDRRSLRDHFRLNSRLPCLSFMLLSLSPDQFLTLIMSQCLGFKPCKIAHISENLKNQLREIIHSTLTSSIRYKCDELTFECLQVLLDSLIKYPFSINKADLYNRATLVIRDWSYWFHTNPCREFLESRRDGSAGKGFCCQMSGTDFHPNPT